MTKATFCAAEITASAIHRAESISHCRRGDCQARPMALAMRTPAHSGRVRARMAGWQRFLGENVQAGTRQAFVSECVDQGCFVDNRPASGIDQQRLWLHPTQGLGVHQALATFAEHQVDRENIGLFEERLFTHIGHADFSRPFGGQVLAPGNHAHAEHLAEPRHPCADAAQAEDCQRLAM